MKTWQPIETAPRRKRGPLMLFYGDGEIGLGSYNSMSDLFEPLWFTPTHWMCLPDGCYEVPNDNHC